MNETLRVIRERRSTRKFKSEQIKDTELQSIIEAGLYAPSAMNNQSWNFTVIQNAKLLEELNVGAKEFIKTLPGESLKKRGNNDKFNIFYEAPTVIVVSGQNDALMSMVNSSAAMENMSIAAESLEVGSCWMGGVEFIFNKEKGEEFKEKLNIPEGYTPHLALLLGYKEVKATKAPARKENAVQYIR